MASDAQRREQIEQMANRSHAVAQVARLEAFVGQQFSAPFEWSQWDGEKFLGGFGVTQIYEMDYWTLRARSSQLFRENKYCAGLIKRLLDNMVNSGIKLEASPEEGLLGLEPGALDDWTDLVESRFDVWCSLPEMCDFRRENTFYKLQRLIYQEALIEGDVLVVNRFQRGSNIPTVDIFPGSVVKTPWSESAHGNNKIDNGVEIDTNGRQVAYWIQQEDGKFRRLPAFGSTTGRRIAWLYYSCDKRFGDARGMPLLSRIIQDIKELDRYRDAALRQAVIASLIVAWVQRTSDGKPASRSLTRSAGKLTAEVTEETTNQKTKKEFRENHVPGILLDTLQEGEEIKYRSGEGVDINLGNFESIVLNATAWTTGIPPEILQLSFSSNYSASQAASAEFKIIVNQFWRSFGQEVCQPVYTNWLLAEVRNGQIIAKGLLNSVGDPRQYHIYGAWLMNEWLGTIKPHLKLTEQVTATVSMLANGLTTHARSSRELNGTKFSRNIRTIARERAMMKEAGLATDPQPTSATPQQPSNEDQENDNN